MPGVLAIRFVPRTKEKMKEDKKAGGEGTEKKEEAKAKTQAAAARARHGAKPYRAPRTPDGQPDLGGFWSNATYTPLERAQNVNK